MEIIANGYSRQAIRLIGKDSKRLAIAHNVAFDLPALPIVRCLAIFKEAVEIEAYGVPIARTTSPKPENMNFAAHAIVVRTIPGKA